MKMISVVRILFLLGTLTFFTGCFPSVVITKEYSDPEFILGKLTKNDSIGVYVGNNVNVKEFVKSFDSEYKTQNNFVNIITKSIADTMKKVVGSVGVKVSDKSFGNNIIAINYNPQIYTKMISSFDSCRYNYLFIVKSIEIGNEVQSSPTYSAPGPYGTSTTYGGGSVESCVVKLSVELWDVSSKKKVIVYTAQGEDGVALFMYGSALKSAVRKAVFNSLKYLKDGTIKSR